jgi:hypothetical protein
MKLLSIWQEAVTLPKGITLKQPSYITIPRVRELRALMSSPCQAGI